MWKITVSQACNSIFVPLRSQKAISPKSGISQHGMQSVLTEDLRDTSAYGVKVAGERVAFKKLYLRMGNGEKKLRYAITLEMDWNSVVTGLWSDESKCETFGSSHTEEVRKEVPQWVSTDI